MQSQYDIIISGAGPAGLASAFYLSKNGFSVLVLEKNAAAGAFPRAETLRNDPVLDEILGQGFMKTISLFETAKRKFNSPGSKKTFYTERKRASFLFEWHKMIARMEMTAREAGADFLFKAEVSRPVLEDGICRGVQLADGRNFTAKTVVACDGYSSSLGKSSGVEYSGMNCPVAKKIITGAPFSFDGMEFFFIAEGSLPFAPLFPASILFIFPRGNGEVETGLMVLSSTYLTHKKPEELPSQSDTKNTLDRLIREYPSYSDKLRGGSVRFEGTSVIPMAGFFEKMMTIPGLVLTGDAIGFIEASGGCGVVSSIKSAKFAAGFLAEHRDEPWTVNLMERMNSGFRQTEIFRKIRKGYRRIIPGLNFLFSTLKTEKRINRFWWIVKLVYKLG